MPVSAVEIFEPEPFYRALTVIRPPTVSDPAAGAGKRWGSGFFGDKDGLLLTAAHNLLDEKDKPFDWVWVCVWNPHTKGWTDCRHVPVDLSLLDRAIDFALLVVPETTPGLLKLSLDVERGDDVAVLGLVPLNSGEGFEPRMVLCQIPRTNPSSKVFFRGLNQKSLRLNYEYFTLHEGVRIAQGMSGGPCVEIVRGSPRVVAVVKAGKPPVGVELPYMLSTPLEWGKPLFTRLEPAMWPGFLNDLPHPAVCPYQGLKAFGEEEARFFFGREDLSERLLQRVLCKSGLVALIGASGSGKSSIALSGLLPLLRRRGPSETRWDAVSFTPGNRPFHRLADSLIFLLERAMTEVDRLGAVKELGDRLASSDDQIGAVVQRIIKKSKDVDRLLVIVDQFEELITLTPEKDGKSFVESMVAAIGDAPVDFVLTLRADYYGHAIQLNPKLSDLLEKSLVNVGSMGRKEIASAIVSPAAQVDLDLEPGLVERLLNDLGGEAGRLPLLEFALTQLWERRRGRLMTHAAYEEFGGLRKAISYSAHTELGTFTAEEQQAIRRIFTRLVRVAEQEQSQEDTRQRILLKDLDPTLRPVIDKLAKSRLIITSRDDSNCETVEISHEALIQEWNDLQDWLNDDREFLLWRQRLKLAVTEWQRTNLDTDGLLRGALLNEAERWQDLRRSDLNERELQFIDFSTEQRRKQSVAERRRQRSQTRFLAVGLAITLAFAGIAVVQWYRAASQSRIAQARTLLSPALLIRNTQPAKFDQAALLAIESLQLDDTDEAKSLLSEAITLLPQQISQFQTDCDGKMIFSPGGRFLACLDKSNLTARLISVSDGEDLTYPPITETLEIATVAASPDGQFLGLGLRDGGFGLLNSRSGESILAMGAGSDALVTFSADGKYFAAAVSDPLSRTTIRLFSTTEEVVPVQRLQTEYPILALTLSPEGDFIGVLHQGQSGTEVTIFDVATLGSRTIQGGAAIPSLALSGGAALIALPYLDNSVRVKETGSNDAEISKLTHQQLAYAIAISDDGKYAASGSEDGTARVMETGTGRLLAIMPVGVPVTSLAFTANNDLVVAAEDKTVRTINVLNRPGFQILSVSGAIGISPGGRYLTTFSGGTASELAIIDRLDGQKRWQLVVPRDLTLGAIQYSRDEAAFVATSGSNGMTAYDLKTQKQYRKSAVPGLLSQAISGDGQTVGWATAGNIEIFRIDESRLDRLEFNKAHLLMVNSDASLVAAVGPDPGLTVFDVATKVKVLELKLETHVAKGAFSPDGRHLAISGENKDLLLYEVRTGRILWQAKNIDAALLLFNHDGSILTAGGGQDTFAVNLLETDTGTTLFQFPKQVQPIGAAFSPDGRYLDIIDDTSLTRHFLGKADLIDQTCTLLARNLSQDEWNTFMPGSLFHPTCPLRP